MDEYRPRCVMCKISRRASDTPFRQLMGGTGLADEVLQENDDWLSVLDVAPVVEGWSLVIHRTHITSLSEANPKSFDGLIALKNGLSNAMSRSYGVRPIFFEHGGVSENRGGACIDHAHLHAVPFNGTVESALRNECDLIPINGIWELPEKANREGYVYFERSTGEAFLANQPDVPHQLIRRIIAKEVPEAPPWQWRQYVQRSDELGTCDKLIQAHQKLRDIPPSMYSGSGKWKLIRDRIPSQIKNAAPKDLGMISSVAELRRYLSEKLVEEALEYRASGNVEELSDVLEVLQTLVAHHGIEWEQLARLAEDKKALKGGFRSWWLLRLGDEQTE